MAGDRAARCVPRHPKWPDTAARSSIGLESRPGKLELTLPEETLTVRVVRQHVPLRRALLLAEGHDLSQPVQPPPALQTMQRRSRD